MSGDVGDTLQPLFYVLDLRQVVGNCAVWWRPKGKGYTCDLKDAGLFTESELRGLRETDRRVPRSVADLAVERHVRLDGEALKEYRR